MTVQGPEQWYIVDSTVVDGSLRSGPFDPDQLRRELVSGRFPGDNLVMRASTGEAISVSAVLAMIGSTTSGLAGSTEPSSLPQLMSLVGRTVPDASPAPLALRPILLAASAALILSVAIPRVAGASAGVHFAWEEIRTDPAGVLCAPLGGLVSFVPAWVRTSPRLRGIVALLAAGIVPAALAAMDRRVGWTEALALLGMLAFATCVMVAQLLSARGPAPLALRIAPALGSLLVAAAYVLPAAGRMPIRGVLDLLFDRAAAIGGHAPVAGALFLLPLTAAVVGIGFIAVAQLRRVGLVGSLPVHIVLSALPIMLTGLGLLMLLDQRPEWVGWLQAAVQVGAALYVTSAGAASAIAAPAD